MKNQQLVNYSSDGYIVRNLNKIKNILGIRTIDDFRKITVLPLLSFSLLSTQKWNDT